MMEDNRLKQEIRDYVLEVLRTANQPEMDPYEELEKMGVEPKDMSRILARAVRLENHGITDEDVTHAVWSHYEKAVVNENTKKLERLRKLAEFWGREGNEQEGLARFSRNFNGKPLLTQGYAAERLRDILGEEH